MREPRSQILAPAGRADPSAPRQRVDRFAERLQGHYAVSVSGNWRVTFRFEDGDAVDVDYVDYH